MPKSGKENFSPVIARKSKLPIPKSCDVKRKRLNSSPTASASNLRQAIRGSPKSCSRVHVAGHGTGERKNIQARRKLISEGKMPLKDKTPKMPIRKNLKDFLAAQYSQEDIEFKSDQSALQSILDGTGIQSTPSSGTSCHQARHTLAAAPFQRASIYAPPRKLGLDDFKKMCEEFAKVPAKLSSSTERTSRVVQPLGQPSTGIHTVNQCSSRMTCGGRSSPKRRCLEKNLRTGNNCKVDSENKPSVQQNIKSMFSVTSHSGSAVMHKTTGSSLDILIEENTEDVASTLGQHGTALIENAENIDRPEADGKIDREILTPKRKVKLTDSIKDCHFTPVRVPKQFRQGYNTTPSTEPRLENITESLAQKFSRKDGRCVMDNLHTPSRVLKKETSEPSTPLREHRQTDPQIPTPSRVPKDIRIGDISTPGRKVRQDDIINHTPQRVLRAQTKENVHTPSRELKQTSIFAAPMRVLKQSKNRLDVENKTNVSDKQQVKSSSGLCDVVKSTDVQELVTECKEAIHYITDRDDEPVSSITRDKRRSDELDEKGVWTTKITACKTPVKQEILTSVVDKRRNIERHHGEQIDSCKTDETVGIRNDNTTEENKTAYYIYNKQDTTQDLKNCTATMQLPIVKSPVEKSGSSPEMPDPATSNWKKSKTGSSLGQSLIFDEHLTVKRAASQSLIDPPKANHGSTTNQNWIECLHKDLERKLLEMGMSQWIDSKEFSKASEEEKNTTHLNLENNNLVRDADDDVKEEGYIFSAHDMNKTAGQLTQGFSQGYHDNANANESRTFDINFNLGTSNSNAKTSDIQDNNSYEVSSSPLTDVNVTSVMSGLQDFSSKRPKEQEVQMPYTLRNTDLTDKVVYPSNVLKNTDDEMPKANEIYAMSQKQETLLKFANVYSKKDNEVTVEDGNTADEEMFPELLNEPGINVTQQLGIEWQLADSGKEINANREVKLYAPTPSKEQWSGPYVSPHRSGLSSTFPLMTPLALKMVARQQQSVEDTPTCQIKDSGTIKAYDKELTDKESKEKCKIDDTEDKCSERTVQNPDIFEDALTTSIAKTPPKCSAFHVVKQTTLSPLVGSLSLRGNTENHGKKKLQSNPQEIRHKKIFMSMNERYKEALLDDEVTRFAARLVEQQVGYFPRGCYNPVAKILMEGDDMHFVPIEAREMEESVTYSIPGSAFSKYRVLAE